MLWRTQVARWTASENAAIASAQQIDRKGDVLVFSDSTGKLRVFDANEGTLIVNVQVPSSR